MTNPNAAPKVAYKTQIDHIIGQFNFIKVRNTMLNMDWKWLMPEENPAGEIHYTPGIDQLAERAREHLQTCCKEGTIGSSSGGLHARNVDGWLSLTFEIDRVEARYELDEAGS
jgi:hypothetical protein